MTYYSIKLPPFHDLTLLQPSERVELVDLRAEFAAVAQPETFLGLARLNLLSGKATRAEWFELVRQTRGTVRRFDRGEAR